MRLQIIQNSLVWVVCNTTKFQSQTKSLLKDLHWLPVPERIKFKIAVLTYKILQIGKPSYLADLLISYRPSRVLRSSSSNLLSVPDIRTSHGRRSFFLLLLLFGTLYQIILRSCPTVSSLCNLLKTYLFPP